MSDSMPGPRVPAPQSGPGDPTADVREDLPGHPGPAADPAAPAPLGVPLVPTGDAGVDTLLTRLADADHLPADGHPEVYEDVHRGLRSALTSLDAPPAPPPAPRAPAPSPSYNHRS
ncbi:hypothetical protein [Streptomyces sp. NPDC001985]|uniref:hypothetical protein n=1 Tax=Streptomyces sp. NPDC001985 TaxID=3154406 RepID=UPI003316AA5C